jgi:histidinol-phosphate aminotransferase
MKNKVKKSILGVKPYIPGKPIEDVKREFGLKSVIKLASNENPYGPSPKVLKAIALQSKSLNRYPDGGCFCLREALSKKLNVDPGQLVFGNGSDEVIVFAARAFLKEGDEVVVAYPSFLIYEIASSIEGAKVNAIPLKDFRYDLKGMIAAVNDRTKIIFLGNPDNPSGQYFTQKDMEFLLGSIRKDILVFIDEAYFEYVDEKDYVDSIGLIKKYKNVVVTRTFSKMYGLAGIRIGFGIADLEIIDLLNRVREPFNVNSIAQAAALACLNDQAYYKKIKKELFVQRKYLYNTLCKLNLDFQETCTNFILINVKSDSSKVTNDLMKKGVIIRNMDVWGMKGYIRVTIGTEKENTRFLKALESVI